MTFTILSESMQQARKKGLKKYQERKRAEMKKNGFKRKPPFPPGHEKQGAGVLKHEDRAPQVRKTSHKPQKRIKPMSEKRAAQNEEYLKLRTEFLKKHPQCMVFPAFSSEEVHHTFCGASRATHFLDVPTWMAVSRKGHSYIHENPKISREKGWLK